MIVVVSTLKGGCCRGVGINEHCILMSEIFVTMDDHESSSLGSDGTQLVHGLRVLAYLIRRTWWNLALAWRQRVVLCWGEGL